MKETCKHDSFTEKVLVAHCPSVTYLQWVVRKQELLCYLITYLSFYYFWCSINGYVGGLYQ